MLNMKDIDVTIKHYEEQPTTLNNCKILADLYICKQYCNEKSLSKDELEETEKELSDILPQYRAYCQVKTDYQRKQSSKECVVYAMEQLCRELEEFLLTLYSCTDCPEERNILQKTLEKSIRK